MRSADPENRGMPGAQVAAGAEPVPYGDVRREDPEDFRHMCDRCCTTISDLHRTCAECASTEKGDGFELCLHCCDEAREAGQVLLFPWILTMT